MDLQRDILAGALDAMVAQAGNRMNQVMKTLTAISTMLMSASLIAGIYGMNFRHMPELLHPRGYYYALTGMVLVVVALILFFRRIRWL